MITFWFRSYYHFGQFFLFDDSHFYRGIDFTHICLPVELTHLLNYFYFDFDTINV